VSKLGYIRNMQMCLLGNCSYFLPHDAAACNGAWDDWRLFSCCDHLLCL